MNHFNKTNITTSFHRKHYSHQYGLSLIELLISLFIFSSGLLSMGQLQTHALKTTALNLNTKQAIQLVQKIAETMTANSMATTPNSYEIDGSTTPNFTPCTPICSAQQHTLNSLSNWKRDIHTQLPEGEGSISKSGETYQIFISWSSAEKPVSNHCNTSQALTNKACHSYQVSIL
ncbi:MAG: type IV pilus modification protein PilV [Gammaproteobacteria bacterium]|nr:type IV pilus modification protein PilV [Gammaproteobacteria bacterium]